jgi:hypothetical protein
MRLSRLVSGFVHLGHGDQARFVVAWSLLGLSRFAILVLPFRLVGRALGEHRDPRAGASTAPLDADALARAARIGASVRLAARHTPWRSECYPQALTARFLLGLARVPHVVSFGVRRDGDALVAHTWVHVDGGVVTGATGHAYTEVGSFAWAPRARSTPGRGR